MRTAGRLRKFAEFFVSGPQQAPRLHPWPWRVPGSPYFLEYSSSEENRLSVAGCVHEAYAASYRFDADGIPYLPTDSGRIYYPLVVSRYALKMRRLALRDGDKRCERISRAVLANLLASGEETAAWGPGESASTMCSTTPFCNIQGGVISTLLRLTEGRPAAPVADLLDRSARRLIAPIEEGGTLSSLEGGPFLEEVPRIPPSHQLGGCISGLFGLYDLADAIDHRGAAEIAGGVEETIARTIELFMTRTGWSLYALNVHSHRYLASVSYHRSRIAKVDVLAQRTGRENLRHASETWRRALESWWVRSLNSLIKTAQVVWLREIRRLPLREG